MNAYIDWDFARGGRTLHAWSDKTVNKVVGPGSIPVTLCGVGKPKRECRYITATDPRCPTCSEKAREIIASRRTA